MKKTPTKIIGVQASQTYIYDDAPYFRTNEAQQKDCPWGQNIVILVKAVYSKLK